LCIEHVQRRVCARIGQRRRSHRRLMGKWQRRLGRRDQQRVSRLGAVNFSGTRTIDRVVVYTLADNYGVPVEPTDSQTFGSFGIVDFTVQIWNGSAWITVGVISGNNLVKRTITFAAISPDAVRVTVTNAL